jgi:hypothetical protein
MKELLITPETAVLLKDKNLSFDMEWNEFYYDVEHDNELIHGSDKSYPNELNLDDYASQTAAQIEFDRWEKTLLKAPTQSLLQSCLRDDVKIEVSVIPAYSSIIEKIKNFRENNNFLGENKTANYCGFVNDNRENSIDNDIDDYVCFHDTYEHALEICLQEALKLI